LDSSMTSMMGACQICFWGHSPGPRYRFHNAYSSIVSSNFIKLIIIIYHRQWYLVFLHYFSGMFVILLILCNVLFWQVCSIIFVDLPFGTGFSYAKNITAQRKDWKLVHHTHQFLRKVHSLSLLSCFCKHQSFPFFLTSFPFPKPFENKME